jgi:hypothetical protein
MKFLLVIVAAVLVTGCVPNVDDYYYMSLQHHADAKVTGQGKPDNASLFFAEVAPLDYRYTRDNYELRIRASMAEYWPSMFVSAVTPQGEALALQPLPFGACGSFENLGKRYAIEGIPAQKYVWSPAFHKACSVDGSSGYKPDQVMAFEVTQRGGEPVGTESIAFELLRNGSYLSMDGL